MSARWRVARKVAFAVVAVYLVLTATFAFVALTTDPNAAVVAYGAVSTGGTGEEAAAAADAYRSARNLDDPVLDRYGRWLVDFTTLDWGRSFESGTPVIDLVGRGLPYTLAYVLPATLLATGVGVAAGVYSATGGRGRLSRLGEAVTYFGFGLPNFWLAYALAVVLGVHLGLLDTGATPAYHEWSLGAPGQFILPTVVLATGLLAGQLSYARAESLEYAGTEFVKLVRAKGAGRLRVARHVLRNAALPIFSLFFTDLLAVLLLNVYVVEFVFGIRGFGRLSYFAVRESDIPLILGTTMFVVLVGVFGNLLQDVAYSVFDPRVDAGE